MEMYSPFAEVLDTMTIMCIAPKWGYKFPWLDHGATLSLLHVENTPVRPINCTYNVTRPRNATELSYSYSYDFSYSYDADLLAVAVLNNETAQLGLSQLTLEGTRPGL